MVSGHINCNGSISRCWAYKKMVGEKMFKKNLVHNNNKNELILSTVIKYT